MVSRAMLISLVAAATVLFCGCPKKVLNTTTSAPATTSPSDPNAHWVVQQTPADKDFKAKP